MAPDHPITIIYRINHYEATAGVAPNAKHNTLHELIVHDSTATASRGQKDAHGTQLAKIPERRATVCIES